ncbi:MAG: metallopeptidase TldD-related protein [Candidatus Acidiferrales bacterium]
MKRFIDLALAAALLVSIVAVPALAQAPVPDSEKDLTLHAMHDEMARARARLVLPGADKPFYIEYRLLDLDIRSVNASFGALISDTVSKSRFMSVDVRVGNDHLDSSNFISDEGFHGFLGSTGQVGIDRDYNSLRQDLWLATDQAYKAALTQMSLKQAFLRSLTKPPEIDDFSQATPLVKIDPRVKPDWTSRNWDDEARAASAGLTNFPNLDGMRVHYYLIYATTYLMNSEGTTIRTSRSLAAIEAAMGTDAADGMPLHNYYAVYADAPAGLPDAATVGQALSSAATQLMAVRSAPLVPDYTGPILFDPQAAGSLLAQILEPSLSGARPPLSATEDYDAFMTRFGGRNEWTDRVGQRVLPTTVSLFDDPTQTSFQGQPLLGHYSIDAQGVPAQRVSIVENGMLRDLLMSRRPGPNFTNSNGHARSAMLSDPQPLSSNLFFQSSNELKPDDLRKKFLATCKGDGLPWCLEVKRMDNPALSSLQQQDFSDYVGELGGDIANGARIPLLLYRVYVSDGHEEPVRGAVLEGLGMRSLRDILGVGDDPQVYSYMQNPQDSLAGTALGSFGSAGGDAGIPSSVVAPSLLLDEIDVRGFHGEPRRLPLVPAPPLK